MQSLLDTAATDDFCYLTTTGRVSERPHEIEIWFAIANGTLYLLAGNHGSDWVQNLRQTPVVTVRLREETLPGKARVVAEPAEDALARQVVVGKYQPRESDDLSGWGRSALAVAVEF